MWNSALFPIPVILPCVRLGGRFLAAASLDRGHRSPRVARQDKQVKSTPGHYIGETTRDFTKITRVAIRYDLFTSNKTIC